MSLISQYLKERKTWIDAGSPYRTKQEMAQIFDICQSCDEFVKRSKAAGKCGVCKCNLSPKGLLLNKIAWATTKCPLDEPKWTESFEVEGKVVEDEERLQRTPEQVATVEKPPVRGCCG